VQVDSGGGNIVPTTITADSANGLGLEKGRAAAVVIKASDVILAFDE
jgi:molybdopterin-binding protein